ncbi:27428_t:CDS:2 [Gigaspora margarita]|uniref:27428_t:CDS:1 n=1 Tax=Gigaspora margarita TaxID=4874 RepID=A0ABN7UK06_GIGMA|nr:27428_t:CDS:2 [Gigaspora margarita]
MPYLENGLWTPQKSHRQEFQSRVLRRKELHRQNTHGQEDE